MVSRAQQFSDSSPSLFDAAPLAPVRQETLSSYVRDHRQRLRARFMDASAAALLNDELLEPIHGVE